MQVNVPAGKLKLICVNGEFVDGPERWMNNIEQEETELFGFFGF
jgi:hypothetical protein